MASATPCGFTGQNLTDYNSIRQGFAHLFGSVIAALPAYGAGRQTVTKFKTQSGVVISVLTKGNIGTLTPQIRSALAAGKTVPAGAYSVNPAVWDYNKAAATALNVFDRHPTAHKPGLASAATFISALKNDQTNMINILIVCDHNIHN